jgi:hypothetical protein
LINNAIVASAALKKTLEEGFKFLQKKIPKLKISISKINDGLEKAANVENVKTIWQVDKKINLNNFYYPSKLIINNKSLLIESLNFFNYTPKVVIQGIAGQGKSILMRYLAGKEFREGSRVPLFIELRKISQSKSLQSLLIEALSVIEINLTIDDLPYIYDSGKFSLLLDGFDEIHEPFIYDTITYLENVCAKYQKQQIIISSRPQSAIQVVPYFDVLSLSQLSPTDFRPILNKFFENQQAKLDDILKSIDIHHADISSLLTTPLMLTLLAIIYKSYSRIPTQLHEFYDNLFHLLVTRHDSTKPGFTREYSSGLNERQLEDLFNSYSFVCTLTGKTSLTAKAANRAVETSIKLCQSKNADSAKFLRDCINNTCLIINEGFQYHFLHKSIREYHAASFVQSSNVELKVKFYAEARKAPAKFKNELNFLSVIDESSYVKYFLIPIYESVFERFGFNENVGSISKRVWDDIKIIADDYGNLQKVVLSELDDVSIENFGINEIITTIIFSNFSEIDFKTHAKEYFLSELDTTMKVREELASNISSWCEKHFMMYVKLKDQQLQFNETLDSLEFNTDDVTKHIGWENS